MLQRKDFGCTLKIYAMPTVHLMIKGEVQGVFYRATAKKIAEKLHVNGWIRNTDEGNVEAMVTGNEQVVQQFIEWCKKGPKRAAVTEVVVTKKNELLFDYFEVIR